MRTKGAVLSILCLALASSAQAHDRGIELSPIGTYASGVFAAGAAEIVAFDPATRRAFVVNASAVSVDVLDLRNPAVPTRIFTIDVRSLGASANSVDVSRGILAVAVEANVKTDPGLVAFYSTHDYRLLGTAPVGALPDMLTFTPDGERVLVANEGEPSGYDPDRVDPEGSISIIDFRRGCAALRRPTCERPTSRAFAAKRHC